MSPLLEYALYGSLIGLALILANFSAGALRQYMRRRTALQRMEAPQVALNEPDSLKRARIASDESPIGRVRTALWGLYVQSGGAVKPPMLAASAFGGALVGFLLAQRALDSVLFSALTAIALALFVPYFLLAMAREKRRSAFVANLPAAMDVIVRSLRAGHPITVAVSLVGRDIAGPVGEEFTACSKELTFGLDMETAIGNIARRMGVAEANVLASAISIQQRSGGNLTEVLARLATLLRDRARLRAKARALSSEGRWSGALLSALPFVMFGALAITSPRYYGDVQDNPIVVPIMLITVAWMSIGMFIIHRMVNFKP